MNQFFGVYKGICTTNADPEGLGRIKVVIPQVFGNGTTESDWAWPCASSVTTSPAIATPDPNQGVWIYFEGGDVNYPVWTGVWNARYEPGFPTYKGEGSPEGVVTATIGLSYQDTVTGAVYVKLTPTGDTGWSIFVGNSYTDPQSFTPQVVGISETAYFDPATIDTVTLYGPRIVRLTAGTPDTYPMSGASGSGMSLYSELAGPSINSSAYTEINNKATYGRILIQNSGDLGTVINDSSANGVHVTAPVIKVETDAGYPAALFTYPGDPNGHISALEKGDLCVDVSTPAVWQAMEPGYNKWSSNTGRIGVIEMFGGDSSLVPKGSLYCNGQSLTRTAYPELFDVITYTYGGSGANFNVPDFRSVSPMGTGAGSHTGTSARTLGTFYGAEGVSISTSQMPSHSHTTPSHTHTTPAHDHNIGDNVYISNVASAIGPVAAGGGLTTSGLYPFGVGQLTTTAAPTTNGASPTTDATGSGTSTPTVSPALAVTFIIWAK